MELAQEKLSSYCKSFITILLSAAKKRYDKGEYWWELRACAITILSLKKPKIILPDISLQGNFTIDFEGNKYCVNTSYIISSDDKYLLGILDSSLVNFFYRNISSTYRGGYLRFIYQYLIQIPVFKFDSSNDLLKSKQDQMVSLVDQILDFHKQLAQTKLPQQKTVLKRQIETTDRQIDELVYELYGLTEEEIKIVESGT